MWLDLAFDVDMTEGSSFGVFEKASAHSYNDVVVLFFEKFLAVMIENELCCFFVRFKAKFFGDKA